MKPNRRDVVRFVCGSAAGLALTPVPWKLLDDTAIWTQNWALIPKPPEGPVDARWTTCSLCPAGCGVRARTVGGVPVSLAGVPGHPRNQGALCPVGLTGHHLPWHPYRLTSGIWKGRPAPVAKVVEEISRAIAGKEKRIGILDGRTRRAVSAYYRRFLESRPGGLYLTVSGRRDATLEALCRMMGTPAGALGLDLERTRTIVSFGAPVLAGWATGANMARLRPSLRLIQIDSRHSRTASLADLWLPIRPGTETAMALGMCHVLLRDGLADRAVLAGVADLDRFRALLDKLTLDRAAGVTGMGVERIAEVARALSSGGPAIALGGPGLASEEHAAIAALNVLTGVVDKPGGFVPRRVEAPPAESLEQVADGSLDVLLIDAASLDVDLVPPMLRRKLAPGGIAVALTAYRDGITALADAAVPAPAYFESWGDVPEAWDAPAAGYAVSAPLLPAPGNTVEPAAFIGRLAGTEYSAESLIRARAAAIHKAGRGLLFQPGQETKAVSGFSEEDAWKAFAAGACWTDDPAQPLPQRRPVLLAGAGERMAEAFEGRWKPITGLPLAMFAFAANETPAGRVASPLETKLYQESDLRPSGDAVFLHPETAAARGLAGGDTAVLRTHGGAARVIVHCDVNTRRDVVEAAVGPIPAGLSGEQPGASTLIPSLAAGRLTPAEIGKS